MEISELQARLRLKGIHVSDDDAVFNLVALNEIVVQDMLNRDEKRTNRLNLNRLDIGQMRALLLSKGLRIAKDDPIFVLLAVNQIVLEELATRQRRELGQIKQLWLTIRQPSVLSYVRILAPILLLSSAPYFFDADWLRHALLLLAGCFLGACGGLWMWGQGEPRPGGDDIERQAPEPGSYQGLTGHDFDQAALAAKLSVRTRSACRAVMFDELDAKAAASQYNLSESHLRMGLIAVRKHLIPKNNT
ncbi:hypothetical protein [Massilia scottii]|uniref:hypothetical protein n=1 Tax=Massilia scottii TaxID=3057166 RepID=UPI002796C036|nr:hypothetical protein [Massilia sp. CCM 9029]MDQ1835208.1 hypothetical protein [Massilia sp. CCM 9029]